MLLTNWLKLMLRNSGQVKNWFEENCYPGEPVFIGSPNSKAEDDGVILSVVLNAPTRKVISIDS